MYLVLEDGTKVELCNELAEQLSKAINVATKECKKDTGFFEGKDGESCWVITSDGIYKDDSYSKSRESLNEFKSREFAEKIRNRQLLERKLIKFSSEYDGDKIDSEDFSQYKYRIYYSYSDNELSISATCCVAQCGAIDFYSKEVAEKAIETYHDDLIKYFTEWRIL